MHWIFVHRLVPHLSLSKQEGRFWGILTARSSACGTMHGRGRTGGAGWRLRSAALCPQGYSCRPTPHWLTNLGRGCTWHRDHQTNNCGAGRSALASNADVTPQWQRSRGDGRCGNSKRDGRAATAPASAPSNKFTGGTKCSRMAHHTVI